MTFRIAPQDMDAFMSGQRQYWRQVNESEGFDIDHIEMPLGTTGLRAYDCEDDGLFYPHAVIVERYARFGLHRYNMSHGTHFQLNHLKKFSMTMNCLASYYITLAACDPTTRSTLNFQVKVDEHSHARLKLTCSIARLQGTPREPLQPHGRAPVDVLLVWPTDFNDTNRFHEIEESELESNDWIRLYLELALCTDDGYISESELSQLRIIKMAIETTEANVTDVYIKFKGLALASISEDGVHVERKVIVRRIINEDTGYVSLLGGYGFSIGEVATPRRDLTRTLPRPRPHVPGEDRPPERSFCDMMNRLAQRRASPFGGTTQQSQPAFGNNTFGNSNTPAFGSSNTPAFGASSTPAFGFGATSTPGFGASSTSSFGSANTPAFGASSTPSFGTSSSPAFGASPTPAFGSSGSTFGNNAFGSGGAFGASSTSAFGASSSPSFNLGSSPAFGQCTSAFGSSTFCSTQSSFGSQGSNSMFGGQSTIGDQQEGSRVMPYAPTTEATDSANGIQPTSKLQSISAMPVYKEKCQEELRWEDYQRGDKGGKLPAGQSPGGAGFGVTNSQPSLFSVSPTNQANPFSSVVTNNFPPTIAPKNSSPFGQTPPNPSNLFGQNPPTPSMFGSSSGFATITPQPFGSAPSQGQGSTPPFCIGGNFNNSQSAPLFNSNPSLGLNGSAFGQNTKPGFAQTNTFSTPSTGFAITFSTSFDGI